LLVTDEIDLSRIESQARELRQNGYRISILGIGTDHGSPVIKDDGSFLKDRRGEIVIPVLDELSMRKLVQVAGGYYRKMTPDDSDIQYLLNNISSNAGLQEQTTSEFETDTWREQGPWLLLLLIPLVALAFRRGYLIVLAILIMPIPETAQALDWDSLWLRADQRGKREFDAGNPQAAAEIFKDQAWKGAAQYRAGDFQATLESLETTEDIEALYNKGNAHARLGQYEEAVANYDQVLKQMPDHEDAKFNKELLEEELENQQEQEKQNQSQQDQEQEKDNNEQRQQQSGDGSNQDQQDQNQQQAGDDNKEQEMIPEQKQEQQQKQADNNEDGQENEKETKPEQNKPGTQAEEKQQQLADANSDEANEEQQATEQWLRRIPDDPAGLLRRKFRYQYQQRQNQSNKEEKLW